MALNDNHNLQLLKTFRKTPLARLSKYAWCASCL